MPGLRLSIDASQIEHAKRKARDSFEHIGQYARRAETKIDKVNRTLSTMDNKLTSMVKGLGTWQTAVAGAAGAAGLGYMINRSLAATQQLEKLSRQTGFSVEAIQELNFAAQQTGVRSDRLYDALGEMTQRMGEASADFQRTGGDVTEMGEGFQAAGIAVDNLDRRNPQQVLYQVAEAIREAETESKALNIAVKTFGDEGGRDMVAMLREGSGALRDMAQRANELGLVLEDDVVQQASNAKERVGLLVDVMGTQWQRVVGELAPEISEMADNMADWVENNQKFLTQDVPEHVKAIAREVKVLGEAIHFAFVGGPSMAAEGIASAIYGADNSADRIINQHERLQSRLNRVNEALSNISQNNPRYDNYASQAEELNDKISLLERTMERMANQENQVALSGDKMFEQMVALIEQTDKGSESTDKAAGALSQYAEEATKAALSIESLAAANRTLYGSATKQDIRRAQPVRDMGRGRGIGGAARGADDEWALEMQRLRSLTPSLDEQMFMGMSRIEDKTKETFDYMEVFSRQTAENMQSNFSDFFFDAWTGELDSMSDYFESFGRSLLRTWADVQSKMLARGLFGGEFMGGKSSDMGGLFGAIASGATSLFSSGAGGGTTMPGPDLFRWSGGSVMSYDTGGTLPEDIYGFGKSGNAYNLHQGETVVPKNESQGQQQPVNVNLTIVAADAKSFSDMAKRNPQAIIGPIKEALNYGDMDLRASIKGA
jgi:uncharacterized protein YdcH (DUF465 family)